MGNTLRANYTLNDQFHACSGISYLPKISQYKVYKSMLRAMGGWSRTSDLRHVRR